MSDKQNAKMNNLTVNFFMQGKPYKRKCSAKSISKLICYWKIVFFLSLYAHRALIHQARRNDFYVFFSLKNAHFLQHFHWMNAQSNEMNERADKRKQSVFFVERWKKYAQSIEWKFNWEINWLSVNEKLQREKKPATLSSNKRT